MVFRCHFMRTPCCFRQNKQPINISLINSGGLAVTIVSMESRILLCDTEFCIICENQCFFTIIDAGKEKIRKIRFSIFK